MYSGENIDEYNRHLTILTDSAETLNSVLVRRDVVYTAVHKNFPRLITYSQLDHVISDAHAQREHDTVNRTVAIVNAVKFLSGLAASGQLDREVATRGEKDVLAIYDAVGGFVDILQQRIACVEKYDIVVTSLNALFACEHNMSVQLDVLTYINSTDGQAKSDRVQSILNKSRLFNDAKVKLQRNIEEFKRESVALAGFEGSAYNRTFSPHRFLNEKILQQTLLCDGDKTINQYLVEQEKLWRQVLAVLMPTPAPIFSCSGSGPVRMRSNPSCLAWLFA